MQHQTRFVWSATEEQRGVLTSSKKERNIEHSADRTTEISAENSLAGRMKKAISRVTDSVSRRDFLRRVASSAGVIGTASLATSALSSPSSHTPASKRIDADGKNSGAQVPITAQERVEIAVHVNQVGYLPHESKRAVIAVNGSPAFLAHLAGSYFNIVDEDIIPKTRYRAQLMPCPSSGDEREQVRYGHYIRHFTARFDDFRRPGRYRLRLSNGQLSAPFSIASGRDLYGRLIPLTLNFFDTQRCGVAVEECHARCHPDDGRIVGGPRDGQPIDASGGWHDAGDYMKFVETSSYVTALLLFTCDMFPALRSHGAAGPTVPSVVAPLGRPLPPVLAQARIGVEWLLKMHPSPDEFYFQVGDESDHDSWRLPEHDCLESTGNWIPRQVHFGVGANLAGRCAAAFALAARLYASHDQPFAHRCYEAARSVYELGLAHPFVKSTLPADFYPEKSWADDMAWGGAELFRATRDRRYLDIALEFAHSAGAAGEVTSVYNTHALAHSTLLPLVGREDKRRLRSYLRQDAETARQRATTDVKGSTLNASNPYGLATPFLWGTAEAAAGAAINCLLYARSLEHISDGAATTGNMTENSVEEPGALYREIARRQRDFILGCNPFDVSFLIGAGSHYPLYPHHQISNIHQTELTGALVGGPCSMEIFRDQSIDLDHWDAGQVAGPPPQSEVEAQVAVYHDAVQDFVTNEPAIDYTAKFVLLAAFYAY